MVFKGKSGDRVFVSWSGGKDAYLSLLKAVEEGLEAVCLLSFVGNDGYSRSHGLSLEILKKQAESLGLPLETEAVTWEGYEAGFDRAVDRIKEKYSATGGVFGDINLPAHRQWVEKMCKRRGIDYNLPLWQMEELQVVEELINRGVKALIIAIRRDLVEKQWLGRFLDHSYLKYCLGNELSPCGENGEAHTLIVDGPLFKSPLSYKVGKVTNLDNHSLLEIIPI